MKNGFAFIIAIYRDFRLQELILAESTGEAVQGVEMVRVSWET